MLADIFVQIPAYRDAELSRTLKDLVCTASSKYKLRICVLWQHSSFEYLDEAVWKMRNVTIIDVPYINSKGSSWARSVLQKNWRGEKYSLLIDSHHRFVKNWDSLLIEMFESLIQKGVDRPILTSYLPKYNPLKDPRGRVYHPLKIYALENDRLDGILYRLTGFPITFWKWLPAPIPADFVCLHFLFTSGDFNRNVLFSKKNYYAGDEVLTSLKSFTHGYDFFHPHRIIGWHLYERETRTPHWEDHPDWHQHESRSVRLMKDIILNKNRKKNHLGEKRTINEYEKQVGIKLIEI